MPWSVDLSQSSGYKRICDRIELYLMRSDDVSLRAFNPNKGVQYDSYQ